MPENDIPFEKCQCGCGQPVKPVRRYLLGHARSPATHPWKGDKRLVGKSLWNVLKGEDNIPRTGSGK